jgi:hypothetical protein
MGILLKLTEQILLLYGLAKIFLYLVVQYIYQTQIFICFQSENLIFKDRKLNIGQAVRKQV